MLQKELKKRNLPALRTREEMLDILQREEYGYLPPKPDSLTFEVTEDYIVKNFCAGKARAHRIMAVSRWGDCEFRFPFYAVIPTKKGKYPFFIHINFRDSVPDRYMPTEELVDNGFAVLSFCYKDVTSDDGDFTNGLAGALYPNGRTSPSDAGKIAMWAWAAQRVMDYAETCPELDLSRSVVCGHSRLGKTALLAGATDERFAFVYSNDSGCSGAAVTRDKQGETVEKIYTRFPYWFCENYAAYIKREHEMPFEQHWLIAGVAPRYVCVGSASEDTWADPKSEMLSCLAASPAYEAMGLEGFVCEERFANIGESFFKGCVGYHLREGLHYFARDDWHQLIDFVRYHTKEQNI